MSISQIAAAIGISVLIAAGGTAPAMNSSETGITRTSRESTTITRTSRAEAPVGIPVRGEVELAYANYSTMDFIAFIRIDVESSTTAMLMVDLLDSEYLLGEIDSFTAHGTFQVRGAGTCKGITGTFEGVPAVLIGCADGTYVNLTIATNKEHGISAMQSVYRDGVLVVPSGYEEVL